MSASAGELAAIYRYPIKSFAGERLEACSVENTGLHGDRVCAFYDETREGWDSYVTARHIPQMLAYQARLNGDEIAVTSPAGIAFGWNEALLEDIQQHAKRKIAMTSYRAPNVENPELMAVDVAAVHLVTTATLRTLEAAWGKKLDERRFRANFVIDVEEETQQNERAWIGKRISIGTAEFQVVAPCERCSIITIEPLSLERDPSLLKKVEELCFGVYASVSKTGKVRRGDRVCVID